MVDGMVDVSSTVAQYLSCFGLVPVLSKGFDLGVLQGLGDAPSYPHS